MSEATRKCVERLRELLQFWPAPSGDDPARGQVALAPYLADDLDEVDLLNKISSISDLCATAEISDQIAREFSDGEEDIHRAVFRRDALGDWLLSSLKFQCPICF